ncbi:hypothetical protein [Gymnodinialimonas hymeniacidonis]|uniref:hypothetical protein n=1 Tax=Gymnodinialimonas hymeniacidonis TaxID=3126508 RepID=UPI0034C653F4
MTAATGAVLFTLLWLVLALVCGGLWTGFAIRGLIRMTKGKGGPWASAMAQLSVVAMLVGLLRFGPTWGIGAVLFPPALLLFLPGIAELSITPQIALYALPITAAVLALSLWHPITRLFSVMLTCATLVISTLVAGEAISARAMCQTAAGQNLTNVTRHPFWWSIHNTGYDFQFQLHGLATRGEDQFAWSYSEMDWYPLPDTIWPNITSGEPACE